MNSFEAIYRELGLRCSISELRRASIKITILAATVFSFAHSAVADNDDNYTFHLPGKHKVECSKLQFAPGNVLIKNTLPLYPGQKHTVVVQAKLQAFLNEAGQPIAGTGLNEDYEVTAVGTYDETVTSASFTTADFVVDPQGTNRLAIYVDSAKDANALQGTGFANGAKIMTLTLKSGTGNFAVATQVLPDQSVVPQIAPFDLSGADDFGGFLSVVGGGSDVLQGAISSANEKYLKVRKNCKRKGVTVGTFNQVPFTGTDPAYQFFDGSTPALFTPVPGFGPLNGIGGPDFQLQSTIVVDLP